MTIVSTSSDVYGDCDGVAHEVTAETLLVLMGYLPPIGLVLVVRFPSEHSTGAPFTAVVRVAGHVHRFLGEPHEQQLAAMNVETWR